MTEDKLKAWREESKKNIKEFPYDAIWYRDNYNGRILKLIDIIEAQSEALEFYTSAPHFTEDPWYEVYEDGTCVNPVENGTRAREALAKTKEMLDD